MSARFNFLDYRSILGQPQTIRQESAWCEHIPFAYMIVDLLKPRLLVELGAQWGTSYFAMCIPVKAQNLTTKCFAVDTWRGDQHTGPDDEKVFETVDRINRNNFQDFSTLIRSIFDEAVTQFDDGSIDLLHIDGTHTLEAVTHDFETWLPKMSERGVMLFHDTACLAEGFGVYRFWEYMKDKYPSFAFEHGGGLGILAVGPNQTPEMKSFLEECHKDPVAMKIWFTILGNRYIKRID